MFLLNSPHVLGKISSCFAKFSSVYANLMFWSCSTKLSSDFCNLGHPCLIYPDFILFNTSNPDLKCQIEEEDKILFVCNCRYLRLCGRRRLCVTISSMRSVTTHSLQTMFPLRRENVTQAIIRNAESHTSRV